MHSGEAISGFFPGNLSNLDASINIGMDTPCGLLFWKKSLSDQNVKMAAIFMIAAILSIKIDVFE